MDEEKIKFDLRITNRHRARSGHVILTAEFVLDGNIPRLTPALSPPMERRGSIPKIVQLRSPPPFRGEGPGEVGLCRKILLKTTVL